MRKLKVVLIFILVAVTIASSKEAVEQSKPNNKKVPEETNTLNTFPLTGIETEEEVTNRAIAVMVNNHPQARPQSGLSKADIVFEMLTEGNITRFLAIYQSTPPEVVGPVRSAREYYFTLASGYDRSEERRVGK